MAELPLGGSGQSVIGGARRPEIARADARPRRAVDSLAGRYVTAMDVGMTEADMEMISTVCPPCRGLRAEGKTGGDPRR